MSEVAICTVIVCVAIGVMEWMRYRRDTREDVIETLNIPRPCEVCADYFMEVQYATRANDPARARAVMDEWAKHIDTEATLACGEGYSGNLKSGAT